MPTPARARCARRSAASAAAARSRSRRPSPVRRSRPTSELTLGKNVTIDAAAAPGVTISGQDARRVFVVNAGVTATVTGLTLRDGYGFELAGGVLNNGTLTLDHVVVADNAVTTGGIDFWKGGGGIYNGDGATLVLRDSTVRDNSVTGGAGGGVYGFFNSTVTIERSTISGNTANDVGGGIRSLGDITISNSTISGNTSTGWHGGGVFHTDGTMTITSSTITDNTSPGGTAGGLFLGSFGAPDGTASLQGSVVAGNSGDECIIFYGGPFAMESRGHNVLGDGICGALAAHRRGRRRRPAGPARRQRRTDPDARAAGRKPGDRRGRPGDGARDRPARDGAPAGRRSGCRSLRSGVARSFADAAAFTFGWVRPRRVSGARDDARAHAFAAEPMRSLAQERRGSPRDAWVRRSDRSRRAERTVRRA